MRLSVHGGATMKDEELNERAKNLRSSPPNFLLNLDRLLVKIEKDGAIMNLRDLLKS